MLYVLLLFRNWAASLNRFRTQVSARLCNKDGRHAAMELNFDLVGPHNSTILYINECNPHLTVLHKSLG